LFIKTPTAYKISDILAAFNNQKFNWILRRSNQTQRKRIIHGKWTLWTNARYAIIAEELIAHKPFLIITTDVGSW